MKMAGSWLDEWRAGLITIDEAVLRVDALLRAYEEAGDQALRTKEKIYEKIAEKLRLHTELEEKHFYPAVERLDTALVREAEEEHQVLKEMLAKIDELAAEDSTFDAKVTVLKELVQHHVREEEREMFPECKSKMPEQKLKENGENAQNKYYAYPSISVMRRFHMVGLEMYTDELQEHGKAPPSSVVALNPDLWNHLKNK